MCAPPQSGSSEELRKAHSDSNTPPFKIITLPDHPNDVRHFFSAIFNPSYYPPPPSSPASYVTVSILRLAHKYEFPSVIQRAVAHLDSLFPLDKERILTIAQGGNSDPTNQELAPRLDCLLDIIALASTIDWLWVLPSLLYIMHSRYSISDVIEHPNFGMLQAKSQVDIVQFRIQCALERENLNAWVWKLPSPKCRSPDHCEYNSRTFQTMLMSDRGRVTGTNSQFSVDIRLGDTGGAFCQECRTTGRDHQNVVASMYWDQYPAVCGFENWSVLEIMRAKWFKKKVIGT